jgi:surface antigen
MKRIAASVVYLAAVAMLVIGCASEDQKRNIGMVAGGVGGGVIGSQFGSGTGKTAVTILGAILGAGVGGHIGGQLDQADKVKMSQALEYNNDGQTLPWRNESSGRQYDMTPTRTYKVASGDYCREFSQRIYVEGREQTAYGNACRQPDGTWKIENMQ